MDSRIFPLVMQMLFGGKAKAETVEPGELRGLLNSLFERKLGAFGAKVGTTTRELRSEGQQFVDACERFKLLDAEPYTADIYAPNVGFIRSQKGLYADVLKRLAKNLVAEPVKSDNAYEECRGAVSHTDKVTSEILKTNAQFRLVVHCYSNHLREFKRSFSSIERLVGLLKAELERKSGEFAEYRAVSESISRFESCGMELEETDRAIGELRKGLEPAAGAALDAGQRELTGKLAERRAELARMGGEASELQNRINLLAAPLERPSRKFDHLSARKRQLHHFIEDPIGTIRDEAEYGEFRALLQQLAEAVRSGAIDVKNREEVGRAASALLGSDLLSMASSFRSAQRETYGLNDEIRGLEGALSSLKEGKTASESAAHRIEALETRVRDIGRKREAEKDAIERLFLEGYGKRISVRA